MRESSKEETGLVEKFSGQHRIQAVAWLRLAADTGGDRGGGRDAACEAER